MNRTHQVWMTLPPSAEPGRGERIRQVAVDRGLVPDVAFTLSYDDGGDVMIRDNTPSLAEAYAAFDGRTDRGALGWLALTEETSFRASIQFCSVTVGERRGVLLRFMEKEFRDLEIGMTKGGVLELIAAVREVCGGREVVWTRDYELTSIMEILDGDPDEIPADSLDDVIAVAEVNEELFSLMEIYGEETWVAGLRFAAVAWARSE